MDEIPILRTAKNKFKSPNFSEYNRNDEKLWDEKLIKLKLKPDKTILRYDRLKLSYKDYFQLKSDNFSLSLMSYFINIMMGIQNAQSRN